ncbi:hypothetical protein A2943_00880 [Candidatus Adlerbacteria bacterium RIFCSPLOWO2_01_FULL_51_16]|uniref:DoxX family protein n=1 Tax=Candidatus Adlerbacteria bacterium RIFCSPLOWO2_01_FULL_51_16 TaxID=1797243 RepID=A0A1F4XHJ9_9BACT|nr:MAG: hypothetical protein A2943_00880 [Candidatus Adlerbacteria bacterium RIFCSPLOWO2_01_FULL_51_16]
MLNPFPGLLDFGFFAPTILRIVVACVFLYVAYAQYQSREVMARIPFPIIGTSLGMGVVWVAIIVEIGLAASLVAGYYTQIAAIVGIVAAAKYFLFGKRWPTFSPISRGTAFLLFIILASLLLSGAGGFAYDLPL